MLCQRSTHRLHSGLRFPVSEEFPLQDQAAPLGEVAQVEFTDAVVSHAGDQEQVIRPGVGTKKPGDHPGPVVGGIRLRPEHGVEVVRREDCSHGEKQHQAHGSGPPRHGQRQQRHHRRSRPDQELGVSHIPCEPQGGERSEHHLRTAAKARGGSRQHAAAGQEEHRHGHQGE